MRRWVRQPGSMLYTAAGGPPPSGNWSLTDKAEGVDFTWVISGTNDSIATPSGPHTGTDKGTLRGATARGVAGGGQWYFEFKVIAPPTSAGNMLLGLCNDATTLTPAYTALGPNSEVVWSDNSLVWRDGGGFVAVATTYGTNDIIGVYYDANNGDAYFYKNNSLAYAFAPAGFSQSACPFFGAQSAAGGSVELRTQQADFTYTQVSGWLAWG